MAGNFCPPFPITLEQCAVQYKGILTLQYKFQMKQQIYGKIVHNCKQSECKFKSQQLASAWNLMFSNPVQYKYKEVQVHMETASHVTKSHN